jgi:hypothetical protein
MNQLATRNAWTHRLIMLTAATLFVVAAFLKVGGAFAQVPSQSGIINEKIHKAWADNKLIAAKTATDYEFVRRAFLDILGRIPTAEEIRQYVNDGSPDKRSALIHRLLFTPAWKINVANGKPLVFEYGQEFAEHWADIWAVSLMTRSGTNMEYHDKIRSWLVKHFNSNAVSHEKMVRELLTATGSWEQNPAVNFVMSHLGEKNVTEKQKKNAKEDMNKYVQDGQFDAVPITSRVTRLFLGVQTQCTQCHDHPFNPEWGQENFWGVNAFFRQVFRDQDPTPVNALRKKKDKANPVANVSIRDEPSLNPSTRIFYERRSGVLMSIKPSFLPDLADLEKDKGERTKKLMAEDSKLSRRQALADFVIGHDNFAKAFVNRTWAHFFGRGLNEQAAADDFGGHNKVVHPEMLDLLAKEFIKYNYDVKSLIEWICNSEAYNLSYMAANKDMAKPEFDAFFTHMALKSMSPEVLFESLATATKTDLYAEQEERRENKKRWMDKLVSNFGDDEGNEMTFNGTIVQALLMMNGKELNDEIRRKDGFIDKLMARSGASVVNEIYLTALGRPPSSTTMVTVGKNKKMSESQFVTQQLATARAAGDKAYRNFCEDLFWSLLNTSEFMLNH